MFWGVADGLLVSGLDDAPQVHDEDAVADMLNDREVVSDEQQGQMVFELEILEEVDDLGLDRDIESADGLIADDEPGLDGDRASDADALPLSAAELMGVALGVRWVEADIVEQRGDAAAAIFAVRCQLVDIEGFADDILDRAAGIQGAEGILEDHLEPSPALAEGGAFEAGDVFALETDLARSRFEEPNYGAAESRFSAAALADETDGFARPDRQADIVHRVDLIGGPAEEAGADREADFQVTDFQDVHRWKQGQGCGIGMTGSRVGIGPSGRVRLRGGVAG